jgi:YD repeat-containing protein
MTKTTAQQNLSVANSGRLFMIKRFVSGIAGCLVMTSAAQATETITYTYDAKGRLVKVVRTGTVNNGVTTEYTHDKANNRKTVKVTNSSNAPPP